MLCTRTAKLIKKNSSLVVLIVHTMALETTVGVKVFPTLLVARAVRERSMRARVAPDIRKELMGLFIHRSSFLSGDAAINNRLLQRGPCKGEMVGGEKEKWSTDDHCWVRSYTSSYCTV